MVIKIALGIMAVFILVVTGYSEDTLEQLQTKQQALANESQQIVGKLQVITQIMDSMYERKRAATIRNQLIAREHKSLINQIKALEEECIDGVCEEEK